MIDSSTPYSSEATAAFLWHITEYGRHETMIATSDKILERWGKESTFRERQEWLDLAEKLENL